MGRKSTWTGSRWKESDFVCITVCPANRAISPLICPTFAWVDNEGRPLGHSRNFWEDETGRIEISLTEPGQRDLTLNLLAVGEKLPDVVFDRIPAEN